jgi:hypothetical protein
VAERDPAARVIMPPGSTAVPGSTAEPTQRDEPIQSLADKERLGWQRETDYVRQATQGGNRYGTLQAHPR